MYERERTLYAFNWDYVHMSAADIGEDEMSLQPAPGINPPVWILGHLAVATDYALKSLGQPTQCPRAWHASFGPGSEPVAGQKVPITKEELLAAIRRGHELVSEATTQVSPEHLEKPHGVELLAPTKIKTLGDLISHLMTTHEAMHIGQLSVWRRMTGRKPFV